MQGRNQVDVKVTALREVSLLVLRIPSQVSHAFSVVGTPLQLRKNEARLRELAFPHQGSLPSLDFTLEKQPRGRPEGQ